MNQPHCAACGAAIPPAVSSCPGCGAQAPPPAESPKPASSDRPSPQGGRVRVRSRRIPEEPIAAEKQWHYVAGGKTEGPVPESRLRELLPTLPVDAMVWNPDLGAWKTPREAGLAPPTIVNEVLRQPSHEPTQPRPAEKQWHYMAGGKTEGPVPESQLRELLPTLPVDAMVWNPDLGAWKTPGEAGLALPAIVNEVPRRPPPLAEEKQWHYAVAGKTEGPVPESRLRELLPTLPAEAVVWNPDLDAWKTPREAGLTERPDLGPAISAGGERAQR